MIRKFIYDNLITLANKIYPCKLRMRDRFNEEVKRLKKKNNIVVGKIIINQEKG